VCRHISVEDWPLWVPGSVSAGFHIITLF